MSRQAMTREQKLEKALIDLTISSAVFAEGHGMSRPREHLRASIHNAAEALKYQPCARDAVADLRTLAEQADAERRSRPGYRADTEG